MRFFLSRIRSTTQLVCRCSIPVKIARLSQTIGAGIDYNDNRVFAQFAKNIIDEQDIILHTKGETIRSYCYITDCISAIFKMLEMGKNGEAYNIANPNTTCSIKDIAVMLCSKYDKSKLKIELQDKIYPDTTKYYLDTNWKANISLEEMFERLILSLQSQKNKLLH